MKIEKLPSGSYRVRKTIDKKTYTLIFDHYPDESEILVEFSKKINKVGTGPHIPFEAAAIEYCKLKKNVISPTTYREYSNTSKRLSESFLALYVDQITQIDIQMEINTLSAKRSPKTVKNYHGFIVSVMKMYRPEFIINTTLPQKQVKEVYIPTDDEIKKLFEYAKNNCHGRYYVPIVLACYGMRRGEICALLPEDITDNIAHITKEKVMDINKEWIIKDMPKTETSVRKVPLPDSVVRIIKEQGYVFEGHPNNISGFINDACKALGIKNFSIHKLRHYFCSRLSSENIDSETIMYLGGWKTDYVMKNVYRHKISEKVQEASAKLTSIIDLNCHETVTED